MATLYDFPLELLNEPANKMILSNSKSMGSILSGYKVHIQSCQSSTDAKAVGLIQMMDFFATTGVCSRMKSAADLLCKDKSTVPNYKITNGFTNFPLDSFIGQIKGYLQGGGGTQVAVVAKTTDPVKTSTVAVEVKKELNTVVKVDPALDDRQTFYFNYHKAADNVQRDLLLSQKLLLIHERAGARKLNCTLALRDLKTIFRRKTCYYTGVAFDQNNPDLHPTLDRIDPNLGYTPSNVVLCTYWCNNFKANVLENPYSKLNVDLKTLKRFVLTLSKSNFKEKMVT
jgi:hypothetical protein